MRILLVTVAIAAAQIALAASDEITQDRAHQLAAFYFARYFNASGGAGLPVLRGDYWEAAVHIGRGGTERAFIRVHRHTGDVS